MAAIKPVRVWTVAEAEENLSEILRLAEEEGPQRIGERKSFIVTAERTRQGGVLNPVPEGMSLGKWLVESAPRGTNLEIPSRHDRGRKIPFIDDVEE